MDKNKFIKIAVPTDDGKTIFDKMLGQARYFYIYELDNRNIRFLEKRVNPYAQTMQHLKTLDVYRIIDDCGIILSAKIGKKGIERLKARGVTLLFAENDIKNALEIITSKIQSLPPKK
jgi:predicted Fe-Mo cluster-binding NifX family protein